MTATRRLPAFAGLVALMLVVSVAEAAAASWYCTAHSSRAYGWGRSPRLATAKAIALRQCAVRTPRGRYCRITSCR